PNRISFSIACYISSPILEEKSNNSMIPSCTDRDVFEFRIFEKIFSRSIICRQSSGPVIIEQFLLLPKRNLREYEKENYCSIIFHNDIILVDHCLRLLNDIRLCPGYSTHGREILGLMNLYKQNIYR